MITVYVNLEGKRFNYKTLVVPHLGDIYVGPDVPKDWENTTYEVIQRILQQRKHILTNKYFQL